MWTLSQSEPGSHAMVSPRGSANVFIFCMVAFALGLTLGQKLPTRDEDHYHFHISHTELFYDTKLLPDGEEVSAYMNEGEPRRFFFQVEESSTPLAFIVTPCGTPVRWNLSLHTLPSEYTQYGQEDDLDAALLPQRPISNLPVILEDQESQDVMSFLTEEADAGVYVLTLETPRASSSVRMYATTTPHSDHAYPALPRDRRVKVDSVDKHSMTLSWKPSPAAALHGQSVTYCLALNTERRYHTHCAATGHIHGDLPPTPPPHAGFGFEWESEQREQINADRKAAKRQRAEDATSLCVGDKTSYILTGLRAAQKYYVSVFVVNLNNNRTATYRPLRLTTKANNKRTKLPDGKVLTGFIKRDDGYKMYKLKIREDTPTLLLALQPCFGQLTVELSLKGRVLDSRTIDHFEKIIFNNVTSGSYTVKVSTERRRSAYFKLIATQRPWRLPYPILPNDTSIRVLNKRTTCHSITLSWRGSERKHRYCVFAKEVPMDEDPLHKLLGQWNKCMSPEGRKRAEKVTCRNVRFKDKGRNTISERIRGLKPNTRYILDVYITKKSRDGQTLSYKTTEAVTKDTCQGG